MCVDGDILDSRIWENYDTNIFSFFFIHGFKINASVMHEQVMNKQEHVKNAYEHFKEKSNIFKEYK